MAQGIVHLAKREQSVHEGFVACPNAVARRPVPSSSLPRGLSVAKPLFSCLGSWTFRGLAAGFGLVGQHRAARARRRETRARRPDKAAARAKRQLVSCGCRKRR